MSGPLEASLELASERAGDITSLVYARLFAAWPEMEALFIRDTDGSVRGQMLSQALEALLDLSGPGHFGRNLIAAEIVNHENLGVPPEVFSRFFEVVRDTVAAICADDWSPGMAEAWESVIHSLQP